MIKIYQLIERFCKKLIDSSLDQYDTKVAEYNTKLSSYQKVSDYLKRENNNLAKRFYVFDLDNKCDICFLNIFTDIFYKFNCSHAFHRNCIRNKFVEFGLRNKIEDISNQEMAMMATEKYANFINKSVFKRRNR